MVIFIILASIVVILVFIIRNFLRIKRTIDWSGPIVYPASFAIATVLTLIGYHLGVYSNISFFNSYSRVPTVGWAIGSLFVTLAWIFLLKHRLSLLNCSFMLVLFVSGIILPFSANGFVQSMNISMQAISIIALIMSLIYANFSWTASHIIKTLSTLLPLSVFQAFRIIKSLFGAQSGHKLRIGSWIKTLLIVCAVLIFFMWILSEADPIFARYIEDFRSQLIGRTFSTILLLLVFSSFLTITQYPDENNNAGWLTLRDITFAVGALTFLFAVFSFVQFKYLFLGSTSLLSELHLTFSQYVRKGFIELLIATFVGGSLVYIYILKIRGNSESALSRIGSFLNTILVGELGFVLFSAFKRDLLYVDTYGLTRVRIIGGMFLIWLACFLVFLCIFTLRKSLKESKIILGIWIVTLIVWGLLNSINIDVKVSRGAPSHHLYTDYFYLMQLSEDSMTNKIEFLDQITSEMAVLTSQKKLSPEEKYQLAGIKLGLLSFIEKRNRLYLYYASDDWLTQYGWRVGQQFEPGMDTWYYSMDSDNHLTTAHDYNHSKSTTHSIPKSLSEIRTFAFYNNAEYQAFSHIKSNEEKYFDEVNTLYQHIRFYQVETQLDLSVEENMLLNELKYPFISIGLHSYQPESLQRVYAPVPKKDIDQTNLIYDQLEQENQVSLAQLNTQCNVTAPLVIYGYLTSYNSTFSHSSQIAYISTRDDSSRVSVIIPAGMTPNTLIQKTANTNTKNSISAIPMPPLQLSSSINSGDRIFVKAMIQSSAQSGSSCENEKYAVLSIQELFGFYPDVDR